MFNLTLSIVLLAAPLLVYIFIIRPRLKAKLTETYAHLDSFWARLRARAYAFRTHWIGTAVTLGSGLPDILVQFTALDFSFLPQPWPLYMATAGLVVTWLMKAFETKENGTVA